jgi:hypothetical protein
MNLTPRGGKGPFILEKWYIDTLMEDGAVLLVYLGRVRLLGVWFSRVTAELFSADGSVVSGDASARNVTGSEERLAFGSARIDGEDLDFEMPRLSGRLTFAARHPPVALSDPFLAEGARQLKWDIEIPDADVTGEVRWPSGGRAVAGRGYRDRVWFDLLPWRFPIRELVWGRAVAGEHAAMWVRATTRSRQVATGWLDGAPTQDAGTAVTIGTSRVLVESAVADLQGLRLGALRPLLRRITGDPVETKWAAPAAIASTEGVAVHEVVRWR